MQIQVNTDHNIDGGEKLATYVTTELAASLSRFDRWLTRVEVHLTVDAAGRIDDKRCVIEARPAGAQPVAVTHHAGSVDDAYTGAAQKLEKVLDTKYSRAHDHKGGDTIRHMEPVDDAD
ncbi:ribosomal subunit interface protein [Actinosynnema sp. ALI-1.44]|uniref:HPF/RaiA family ribosome-associated protein n=1 Tax=Actinosynnema sp. ALI-1.44 TaxID=1933779 RepID=UPI00097BFEF3|nr:HPF/RaiA family ribosome-associated protein [Actinosynnema sp. ALI-1.44]ONI87965.1 ribosomal subunit interface protein [Actinosynnema sp. ALI-1.44]